MSVRTVLLVGATGQQGGSVLRALLKQQKTPATRILALTRDASTPRAKALVANNPNVEVVEGDSSNPAGIFASRPKGSINGIFIVTTMGKVAEDKQGIPLIDAAVAHGVQHIVFSSVDRGGNERSWENPTNVNHFYEKHNVEIHLRDKAAKGADKGKFTWTILRPVAFLDNWNPGMFGSMYAAMLAARVKPETKVQHVSVHDIGVTAAMALTNPEKWSGRAVGLAGDEMTLGEAKTRFKKAMGKELPQSWTMTGRLLLLAVKEMGTMLDFFQAEGYGVKIDELKKEVPMQDFETWLKESSKWTKA